ncbi:MAG: DNA internalization-related competence protein ComEC/Rec2 [Chloroflexi bacterium]|nr:DNA internalization-related competence protein ComEC/Rec2 [Chloroflexota bacterium]
MSVVYMVLAWFVGVWLASVLPLPPSALVWLVGGGLCVLVGLIGQRRGQMFWLVCVGMAGLGCGRMLSAQPVINTSHVSYYNNSGELTLTGLVIAEPDVRDRSVNLRLQAETLQLPGGLTLPVTGVVLVQASRFPLSQYGDRLELRGELEVPPESDSFSYKDYLARQGIHSLISFPRRITLAEGQGSPFRHAILQVKSRAQATISQIMREPQASLLTGILLGNDNGLPPTLKDDFRTTGMSHIIAISGFNVMLLVGVLLKVLEPVAGKRYATILTGVGIVLYAILVGGDASVVRATLMGGLYLFSTRFLGRPTYPFAALFGAGFVMTLADPLTLWDVGFQLSFMATLGLMLYADRFSQALQNRLAHYLDARATGWVMALLSEAVLVSLAAQVLTLPLMMAYFGQLSLVSLLANVLVLPVQPAVMVWGGLATLVGLMSPVLGQVLGWVAWLFLWYTVGVVRLLANVPAAAVPITISPSLVIILYALILGLTWWSGQEAERRQRLWASARRNLNQKMAATGSVVVGMLALLWGNTQADGQLHLLFFDVGQGDAIFIQTPSGRQILIDGGLYPSVLQDQLGRQMPFWDRELDFVIATHPDADHVAGLPGVWERYAVGQLITDGTGLGASPVFDAVLQGAEAAGTPIHRAQAGEMIVVEDGVWLEILHPAAALDPDNQNDNSVSVRLVYEDFSLLLTGDAEQAGEAAMLASGRELQALVFKAGHHGSNTSSSAEFLAAVRPRIVIVSAGLDNRYGHPHRELLERVAQIGAVLLRTDELGTIEIVSNGEEMWLQAYGK